MTQTVKPTQNLKNSYIMNTKSTFNPPSCNKGYNGACSILLDTSTVNLPLNEKNNDKNKPYVSKPTIYNE